MFHLFTSLIINIKSNDLEHLNNSNDLFLHNYIKEQEKEINSLVQAEDD